MFSSTPASHNDHKKTWDFFQKHHWVSPEFAQTPIFASWERCIKQCSPHNWSKPHVASGYTLKSLIKRNQSIIACATTVVEDTYDLLRGSDVVLLVTDDNGCTLFLTGDDNLQNDMSELGFKVGCFFSEGKIGTNAINLAIDTHMPIQVCAEEHFNRHLHSFGSAAAPIFDSMGRLRGSVALFRKNQQFNQENLVITSSMAKEISMQIHISAEQESTNRLISAHNATLECMDDGLIVWDEEDIVTLANQQSETLLSFAAHKAIDRPIFDLIRFPPFIQSHIENHNDMIRKQTTIEVNGEFVETIISFKSLPDGTHLLFVHPIDKIRKLAQQQAGNNAKFTFATLPGISRKIKHLVTVAKRCIKSKAPMLISGEDGVGKTDLAMAIHNESGFVDGPFITLNCRSLNSGHEGLDEQQEGDALAAKFELAQNGTLFLENVEYLTQTQQSILLKSLKTELFDCPSKQRVIPVKFQCIASTTSDLSKYVARNSFGRQLYYQISANELYIPPLRERQEDIEHLILKLVNSYERRHNVAVSIEKDAMDALVNYDWLANNSELKSRVEKVLLNRSSNLIGLSDIPDDLKARSLSPHPLAGLQSLEEAEKQAIVQAWNHFEGKMHLMAKSLGIGRTTLWRKIQKYGLG
jgi:transcriptional activator for dhaKLM operon